MKPPKFPEQKEEIQRILLGAGASIDEAAAAAIISPDTLRKYAGGYQKAGEKFMAQLQQALVKRHFVTDYDALLAKSLGPRTALKNARIARGLSFKQVAKLTRYDAGLIEAVEEGRAPASEGLIEALCREFPDLDKDEMMGGSDLPRVMNESGLTATTGSKPQLLHVHGKLNGRYVPLLSQAQAGCWDAGHTDGLYDHEAIFAAGVTDRRAFAIKISGNSMEHVLEEGDVVICSPDTLPFDGEAAVVRTFSEQVFVKFWHPENERVVLVSANKDFEPIRLPIAEIAGVWPIVQRIQSKRIRNNVIPK